MNKLAITESFNLNWKFAAPRDFRTLEYFVTPNVSIVFDGITNGREFHIGAFITQDYKKEKAFMTETLHNRSDERIKKAFVSEEVSAFFTEAEMVDLKKQFEEEKFICRILTIHKNGAPIDLFALGDLEFKKTMAILSELGAATVNDIRSNAESIKELHDDIYDTIEKKFKKAEMDKELTRENWSVRKLQKHSIIGGLLTASSVALKKASKFLFNKGGIKGNIAGTAVGLLSSLCGIIGLKLINHAADVALKGVVYNYV